MHWGLHCRPHSSTSTEIKLRTIGKRVDPGYKKPACSQCVHWPRLPIQFLLKTRRQESSIIRNTTSRSADVDYIRDPLYTDDVQTIKIAGFTGSFLHLEPSKLSFLFPFV